MFPVKLGFPKAPCFYSSSLFHLKFWVTSVDLPSYLAWKKLRTNNWGPNYVMRIPITLLNKVSEVASSSVTPNLPDSILSTFRQSRIWITIHDLQFTSKIWNFKSEKFLIENSQIMFLNIFFFIWIFFYFIKNQCMLIT